jgi:tRNA(fMet)-specific endonuclease VapC
VRSWDAEASDWYATIRAQLERDGSPIGEKDMMIAAHAISARALLVTNNTRHFERIKDVPLSLINWV